VLTFNYFLRIYEFSGTHGLNIYVFCIYMTIYVNLRTNHGAMLFGVYIHIFLCVFICIHISLWCVDICIYRYSRSENICTCMYMNVYVNLSTKHGDLLFGVYIHVYLWCVYLCMHMYLWSLDMYVSVDTNGVYTCVFIYIYMNILELEHQARRHALWCAYTYICCVHTCVLICI